MVALCASLAAARSKKPARHSAAKSHVTSHKKSTHSSRYKKRSNKRVKKVRGQQAIDPTRAREIQQALIRANYLQGDPSGVWDQATKDAMVRYQADNGWQTKSVPDARALIKLGLGPSHANLINPESIGMPAGDGELRPGGAAPQ